MGSANTVVNALNSAGKVSLWIQVVLTSLVALFLTWKLVTGKTLTIPDKDPKKEPMVFTRGWLIFGLVLTLGTLIFEVSIIRSNKPIAKAYRTMQGGRLLTGGGSGDSFYW